MKAGNAHRAMGGRQDLRPYGAERHSQRRRRRRESFKWLAADDQLPDPTEGLHPPRVTDKLVPVFTGEELTRLEHAVRATASRGPRHRDHRGARATGIRLAELAELAALRYHPGDPRRSDIDLWRVEITSGKGGKDRIVRIGHQAARSLSRTPRQLPARPGVTPQLWLGVHNREPLTSAGLYQMIARRGRQCGVDAFRTGSGTTSATPGWTAAALKATSWNSTAGPPRRCSAGTAPAPAAPGPAAPTTAS